MSFFNATIHALTTETTNRFIPIIVCTISYVDNLLLLSEELGGPLANFSNEQIRDAIARYNQKHSSQNTVSTSADPLETYYSQCISAIKREHPEARFVKDTDGKYYVERLTKNILAVIYENPHLVRLVNTTTNLHVEF